MALQSLIPWMSEKSPMRRRGFYPDERPFSMLQRAISDMFEDMGRDFSLRPFASSSGPGVLAPCVDISEDENEVHVSVELPGVKEQDIDVSMSNEMLTIKAEKREEKEEQKRDYYRNERSFGRFLRTIPLPSEVDQEKVSAQFRDGVLKVDLPKNKEAQQTVKRIEVKH